MSPDRHSNYEYVFAANSLRLTIHGTRNLLDGVLEEMNVTDRHSVMVETVCAFLEVCEAKAVKLLHLCEEIERVQCQTDSVSG